MQYMNSIFQNTPGISKQRKVFINEAVILAQKYSYNEKKLKEAREKAEREMIALINMYLIWF